MAVAVAGSGGGGGGGGGSSRSRNRSRLLASAGAEVNAVASSETQGLLAGTMRYFRASDIFGPGFSGESLL